LKACFFIYTIDTAPIFENVKAGLKLTWLEPIAGSCLHGVCGDPSPSSKIAAFDIVMQHPYDLHNNLSYSKQISLM
jgi:hypothetical protein